MEKKGKKELNSHPILVNSHPILVNSHPIPAKDCKAKGYGEEGEEGGKFTPYSGQFIT
jgi:hypothetical protein